MPLTHEQRVELLEKARAVKASKKAERDSKKIPPKKGRPKKETKTLNLDDVADETNVEEITEDIKNMEINKVEEPTKQMELPKQEEVNKQDQDQEEKQEQNEVEIVEEIVKKPKKKKKIIRRYIEPSSDSETEIIEEFIKKKPKQPKAPKISPRYHPYSKEQPQPEPVQLTPPTLNLFCY
jgi:cobalamin biosynthesis protein CobT